MSKPVKKIVGSVLEYQIRLFEQFKKDTYEVIKEVAIRELEGLTFEDFNNAGAHAINTKLKKVIDIKQSVLVEAMLASEEDTVLVSEEEFINLAEKLSMYQQIINTEEKKPPKNSI